MAYALAIGGPERSLEETLALPRGQITPTGPRSFTYDTTPFVPAGEGRVYNMRLPESGMELPFLGEWKTAYAEPWFSKPIDPSQNDQRPYVIRFSFDPEMKSSRTIGGRPEVSPETSTGTVYLGSDYDY